MADRRMLWKVACQSKKLSKVSLPAALLWTWAIPWFDRDGYLDSDPYYLKINILPNRRDLDEASIQPLIDELVSVGLWITFLDQNGEIVIHDPRFKDFQRIEYQKEIKSKWEGKEFISTSARRVLDDASLQREGKEREGKESNQDETPVDNSAEKQEQKAAFLKKYAILENRIKDKFGPRINLQRFFQQNMDKNHDAFFYSWEETLKQKLPIPHPEAYAQKILDKESGNFNEREFQEGRKKQGNIFADLLNDLKKLQGGVK